MKIQDLKGRTIIIKTDEYNSSVCGQQVGIFDDGETHMLFFRVGSDAWGIAKALNVPESAIDMSRQVKVAISKETYLDIAAEAAKHNNGKGIYSYSQACPYREIPRWANEVENGHWDFYIGQGGKETKHFCAR